MARVEGPPVVAIINTNDDTVEMLRMMLEGSGMVGVSLHMSEIKRGGVDFAAFVDEHDPKVLIVDLPPPYDRSWLMYQHLRSMECTRRRRFVLTSTNPARLREIAGADEPVLEVIGKPYDLEAIVDAVRKKLEA